MGAVSITFLRSNNAWLLTEQADLTLNHEFPQDLNPKTDIFLVQIKNNVTKQQSTVRHSPPLRSSRKQPELSFQFSFLDCCYQYLVRWTHVGHTARTCNVQKCSYRRNAATVCKRTKTHAVTSRGPVKMLNTLQRHTKLSKASDGTLTEPSESIRK
jgi:hypothetical protein